MDVEFEVEASSPGCKRMNPAVASSLVGGSKTKRANEQPPTLAWYCTSRSGSEAINVLLLQQQGEVAYKRGSSAMCAMGASRRSQPR